MTPAELRKAWEIFMLALAMWREAQNQPEEVIATVGCSIRNRVLRPRWWGHDWITVIQAGYQYSSFNRNDPNSTKFPPSADQVFPKCLAIAQAIHDIGQPDLADGADSYFDKSLDKNPPEWALSGKVVHVKDAGDFHFYHTLDAMSA